MAVHICQSFLDDTQTGLLYGRKQSLNSSIDPKGHAQTCPSSEAIDVSIERCA